LKEFVAYVKANSDKLNMAHAGVGSITHFTCLLLNSVIGANPAMIPFNGSAPAINALVAGQVDYMCDPVSDIVRQVEAGTMKVYATGTAVRNPALPNIPTAKEAGLPEFAVSAWYALFASKGTPQPVLDTLYRRPPQGARRRHRAQAPVRSRLRDSRQIETRAGGAREPREKRGGALVDDHQGGERQGRVKALLVVVNARGARGI
jgi:Tripartite tricarboxylate transporter family receptor